MTDQQLKFRAKYWVEITDEAYGTYSTKSSNKIQDNYAEVKSL